MFRFPLRLWLVVFLWWTLHGLALAMQVLNMPDVSGPALSTGYALRTGLVGAWLWVPITMAVIGLSERYPIERPQWLRAIVVHIAAIMGIVVFRALAVELLNPWVGWYQVLPDFPDLLATSAANNVILAGLIVGTAHALLFYRRAQQHQRRTAELEARLAQARLQALSAQLNPHFLFNALNSIAELVHQDADAADRMLVALGELLRASLESADVQHVSLADELALLNRYVDIEKVRLRERLHVEWMIDPSSLDMRVPRLLLQPLVENAIQHAVATRPTPGRIDISAQRENRQLRVEISDDGGHRTSTTPSRGIGLSNTAARLQVLYGTEHEFTVAANAAGGTSVSIHIPAEPIGEAA